MLDLGTVRPGTTIFIPFDTFSGSTGAPITLTGLATSDILVYKDGGTTERASTSGYTLLDTDGIDFDAKTGIHGVSISLADNTTAGFWAAGSRYFVVIGDVTVDTQTLRFIAARFTIGYEGAVLDTTIATLASQTSFTLTAGSADNSAYVGCVVVIHDVASAVQMEMGVISAYTGSTRTVTLAADPGIFTAAASDNISILPRVSVHAIAGTAQTARDIGASVLLSSGTGTGQVSLTSGLVTLAAVTHTGAVIPTVTTTTTATNLTNLPAITSNWLTAAGIAAGALDGKGDWNIGKTGYALTQAFPTNFASMAIDASGHVILQNASLVTAKLGTFALAKTTNITGFNDIAATDIVSSGAITTSAGAVTNVSTVTLTTTATNLTNLPAITANWLTASGLATDAVNEIADGVLSRNVSNVEATAGEHTLCTVILATLESDLATTPGSWLIKRTNGTTTHATKTVTTNAAAELVTKVE